MADKSRAKAKELRKAKQHFHGQPCKTSHHDTGKKPTNFPTVGKKTVKHRAQEDWSAV